MKECLQDVKETRKKNNSLFDFFNPNIGMTGWKSQEELLRSLIANLQPIKMSFDLGSLSGIVIINFFSMVNFGKLNFQIHIKWIKGDSLKGFL